MKQRDGRLVWDDALLDAIADVDRAYGGPGMPTWDQCEAFNRLLAVHAHELAEQIREEAKDVVDAAQEVLSGDGEMYAADLIDPEVTP